MTSIEAPMSSRGVVALSNRKSVIASLQVPSIAAAFSPWKAPWRLDSGRKCPPTYGAVTLPSKSER